MIDLLLTVGLSNACLVLLLAIAAMLVGTRFERPHLAHLLWLLVFVKLVTPPLVYKGVSWVCSTTLLQEKGPLVHASFGSSLGTIALLAILGGAPRPPADGPSWPQWRGPERNGVAARSPALATSWPKEGPPCLWKIDEIPSGGEGGYGSPVVAGNRVYLYVNWRYRIPLETRILSDDAIQRLGRVPEGFPQDLLEDLEKARSSAERKALSGRDLEEWVKAWIEGRLEEEGRHRYRDYVRERLHQGEEAIPLRDLERLETIHGQTFPNQSKLDAWLDANGLADATRKRVLEAIPVEERRTKDVVLCLDAATGRQLWKRESPGSGEGASSTLCVADERCYGLASTGEAFCLDAATGRDIWRVRCGGGHSSFLVEEGRAVLLTDALTALDASKGEVVWKQKEVRSHENSAVSWSAGGTKYLICNSSEKVACVTLSDGAIRWAVQGGGPSTAAVAGDLMAILTDKEEIGLLAYRITPGGAQKLWNIPELTDRGASPIAHEGRVYAVASDRTVCVDARNGRVLWEGKPGRGDVCSPLLADGKLIASLGSRDLAMMRATGDAFELLGQARIALAQCSSPAFADGRLYARLQDGLACYDLAAPRAATPDAVCFRESFDDADLPSREWYDVGEVRIAGDAAAGKGCIEYEWTDAQSGVRGSSAARRLFEPTEELAIRFYLRLSKGWGWSGQSFHPHLTYFMTTENSKWHGPAASHLTLYIEPVGGKLRLAAQDIQNADKPHGLTQGPLRGGYNGKFYDSEQVLFNDDQWHCIEAYFKLNTLDLANDQPKGDGVVRGWFDGRLVIDHTDVVLRSTDFPNMKFNHFLMAPYFGSGLLPHPQKLWIDELAVGTKRLGPLPGRR